MSTSALPPAVSADVAFELSEPDPSTIEKVNALLKMPWSLSGRSDGREFYYSGLSHGQVEFVANYYKAAGWQVFDVGGTRLRFKPVPR